MNLQSGHQNNRKSTESGEINIEGLIDSILDQFEQYYVYPEIAARMKSFVHDGLKDHQYDKFQNLEALCGRLSHDLREVSGDGHVAVYPSARFKFLNIEGDALSEKQKLQAAKRNYGFIDARRLTGNIGYLKFNYFEHPSIAGATAAAAIQFLANSDALIIDLRDNCGGEEAMVQFLLSYFFSEPKHLLNVYNKKNELIEQSWTYSYVPGRKMCDTELFVLISGRTGSGAEAFAFDLQCYKRATLIGETTKGIAHMVKILELPDFGIRIHVPYARPANPVTNTCWERCGVKPDIEIAESRALTAAHREALQRLMEKCDDADMRRDLEWALPLVEAQCNPIIVTKEDQIKYSGIYDDGKYSVVTKDGRLYWRYTDSTDYGLTPITADVFGFDDTEDDRFQFVRNNAGDVIGFQIVRKSGGEPILRRKTGEL